MIDLLQTGCIVHLLRPSRRQDARRLLGYSEGGEPVYATEPASGWIWRKGVLEFLELL
jgi:hypothetical protein